MPPIQTLRKVTVNMYHDIDSATCVHMVQLVAVQLRSVLRIQLNGTLNEMATLVVILDDNYEPCDTEDFQMYKPKRYSDKPASPGNTPERNELAQRQSPLTQTARQWKSQIHKRVIEAI